MQQNRFFNLIHILIITVSGYLMASFMTSYVFGFFQARFIPEITIFASLLYLPHGVRILTTWAWGWKAIFPLFIAEIIANSLFRSSTEFFFLSHLLFEAHLIGATCAFISFELFRWLGFSFYAGENKALSWKSLLLVGLVASLINSIGKSILFSGLIFPGNELSVSVTYLIGDLAGLFTSMLILMVIFRWVRLARSGEFGQGGNR